MNYTINPKNGDKLSILGFGYMRFGGEGLASSFRQACAKNAESVRSIARRIYRFAIHLTKWRGRLKRPVSKCCGLKQNSL